MSASPEWQRDIRWRSGGIPRRRRSPRMKGTHRIVSSDVYRVVTTGLLAARNCSKGPTWPASPRANSRSWAVSAAPTECVLPAEGLRSLTTEGAKRNTHQLCGQGWWQGPGWQGRAGGRQRPLDILGPLTMKFYDSIKCHQNCRWKFSKRTVAKMLCCSEWSFQSDHWSTSIKKSGTQGDTSADSPSYFASTAWTSAYACSSRRASRRFSWMLNMLSRGNSFIS